MQKQVSIHILDMPKLLVKKILDEYPPITKVGILATTGSIKSEIYQKSFKKVDIKPILLSEEDQKNLLMRAIYGNKGIKAGEKIFSKKLLIKAAQILIENGSEAIVLVCTEIPLVIKQNDFDIQLFDPMEISAKELIKYAEKIEKFNFVTVEYELLSKFKKEYFFEKKIAILHHDLEFAEKKINELIQKSGFKTKMLDIRTASINDFSDISLVLNRVYASVANRDYGSIQKVLDLLKELENRGVNCLNSYETSKIDYDKYYAYKKMSLTGIPTPKTYFINSEENINCFLELILKDLSFPLIIKRNVGGRGKDISRIDTIERVEENLKKKFNFAKKEKYFGGFIVQEFIKSIENYDCRLGIINNEFSFSYSRSLISYGTKDPWLASTTNGSVEGEYIARDSESNISIKASIIIGAKFNELDIMFSKKGPIIIENNPTPNYSDCPEDIERIIKFVEYVVILNENLIISAKN